MSSRRVIEIYLKMVIDARPIETKVAPPPAGNQNIDINGNSATRVPSLTNSSLSSSYSVSTIASNPPPADDQVNKINKNKRQIHLMKKYFH